MEAFTLAAVSLIIALSLIIYKRDDPLKMSYAALCLAIFFSKAASLFAVLGETSLVAILERLSLLSLPPLLINFTKLFLKGKTLFSSRDPAVAALFSVLLFFFLLLPGGEITFLVEWITYFYLGYVILLSFLSLYFYVKRRARGVEKRRLGYLVVAVLVAFGLSLLDFLNLWGISIPPMSNLVMAVLLYFILLIIAYPHLTELHELMAKALVVSITTGFAVLIFYLVIGFFTGASPLPFTHVLMACFAIVISISPFKALLEKIFKFLYPQSKDVFTSLYALDAKLEREKAQLLQEMAPVLAHEIRNPLGSIKGAAQYLLEEATEENSKLLSVIVEEVDRLNNVVSQFLEYAKPSILNLKIEDVNGIVERAVSIMKANKKLNRINFELELSPSLPLLRIDGDQILQLILNMGFNAIDAMPEGGTLRIKTIRGKLPEATRAVGILIQDSGMGIEKEEMKNIFKPFFTTKKRGVGLGLAICQKIAKNHGGYIRVKSTPGKGTTFFVCIGSISKGQTEGDKRGG